MNSGEVIELPRHFGSPIEGRSIFEDELPEHLVDTIDLFQARGAIEQRERVLPHFEEAAHLRQVSTLTVIDTEALRLATELLERPPATLVMSRQPLLEPLLRRLTENPPAFDVSERGTRTIDCEHRSERDLLLTVAEARADAADGLTRSGDVFVVPAPISGTRDPPDVRNEAHDRSAARPSTPGYIGD